MKKQSLFTQTAVLSGANTAVRAMGFAMRIWMSRVMGAEALGILELASSAHMLWLAPVTSGLPMAVSRTAAQALGRGDEEGMRQALAAGKSLAVRIILCMMPPLLIASPFIARLLGDARTLPALWCYLPCLPVLGLSAAYNGYCYGIGNTLPPALSEFIEQALRFLMLFTLLRVLPQLSAAWTAALPAASLFIGELLGLLLVISMLRRASSLRPAHRPGRDMQRKLLRIAAPMTTMRICNTLMRACNAALIPIRLQASGLSAQEATARLGMFSGMAMPLVMLPAVITGALAMVATPAIASRERNRGALGRLLGRLIPATLIVSTGAMGLIWLGAPFFAGTLYRQPDLFMLLRALSPLVLLMGVQQVVGGMLTGFGKQRSALYASLSGSIVSLVLSYTLAAQPALRLFGCAIAMTAGHALSLLLNLRTLIACMRKPIGSVVSQDVHMDE